jgi:hypothetical protein
LFRPSRVAPLPNLNRNAIPNQITVENATILNIPVLKRSKNHIRIIALALER